MRLFGIKLQQRDGEPQLSGEQNNFLLEVAESTAFSKLRISTKNA
jgi:hypothetical protein